MKTPAKFAKNGEEIGEYDLDDLEVLIERGIVGPDDHYWREGMSEWEPVQKEISARRRLKQFKLLKLTGLGAFAMAMVAGGYLLVAQILETKRKEQEANTLALRKASEEAKLAQSKEDKRTISRFDAAGRALDEHIKNDFSPHFNKYSKAKTYFPKIFDGRYGEATIDHKKLAIEGGSSYSKTAAIIFFVSDNGLMELHSSYYGDKWLFHVAIESSNDKGYFKTPNADPNRITRKTDDGDVSERLSFDAETSETFLRALARSKQENPRLSFLDRNGETVGMSLTMGTKYIDAVRDTVKLADEFRELASLKQAAISAYLRQASDGAPEAQYSLSKMLTDELQCAKWLKASAAQDYWPAVLDYAESIKESDPKLSAELTEKGYELAKKKGINLPR